MTPLESIIFLFGLILLGLLLFPKSKLIFIIPVLFFYLLRQEGLYLLPMLSVSFLIILRYFKKEEGLGSLNLFFLLLPGLLFSLLEGERGYVPILPFPRSLNILSAPFPIFLSILIILLRGSPILRVLSIFLFLSFLLPSLNFFFYSLLFLLTIGGVHLLEKEIFSGDGEFFSKLMVWIWRGIKVLFFLLFFFWIFIPEEKLIYDALYIFLSLLSFELGFLLKSATILIRHKVYFSAIGFVLSTMIYFSF